VRPARGHASCTRSLLRLVGVPFFLSWDVESLSVSALSLRQGRRAKEQESRPGGCTPFSPSVA